MFDNASRWGYITFSFQSFTRSSFSEKKEYSSPPFVSGDPDEVKSSDVTQVCEKIGERLAEREMSETIHILSRTLINSLKH